MPLALALILALLALAPVAHATPSTVAPEALTPATSFGRGDADMGPGGDAVAAWIGSSSQIYVSSRPAGGSWTTATSITSAVPNPSGITAEVGPDGSALVVVTESSFQNGRPWALYRSPAGVWSGPEALTATSRSTSSTLYFARAAYDDAGNVTVAWRSASEVMVVSRLKLSGTWSSESVFSITSAFGQSGGFDVAVEGDGDATLVWADAALDPTEQYSQDFVAAATRTGPSGTWSAKTKIGDGIEKGTNPGREAREVELDVNDSGQAVAAWQGWTGTNSDRRVRAAVREAAAGPWLADEQISTSAHVTANDIGAGIDGDGEATLLWYDQNDNAIVRSTRAEGGSWSSVAMSTSAGYTGVEIPFDMAENGAWLAIFQRTGNAKRVLARDADGLYRSADYAGQTFQNESLTASVDAAGNGLLSWVTENNQTSGDPRSVHVAGWDATGPQLTNLQLPTAPEAGQELDFSVDPVDVWRPSGITTEWDFGDGSSTATGADVTHTYATDGSYNVTVTATDDFGNETEETHTLQVDADQPPVVEITDGHPALSNDNDPSFAWTVDDSAAAVTCELTGPSPSPSGTCGSLNKSYTDLSDGDYVFTVSAKDAADQVGDDNVNFTIDTVGPDSTEFTGGPDDGDRIKDRQPNFTFAAPGETSPEFECRVDSSDDLDWDLCDDDGWQPPTLGDGSHTVDVRAVDLAGNPDATPASVTFVVDNVPPGTAISGGPGSPTNVSQLNFTLVANGLEAGETASYRCRIYRAGTNPLPAFDTCSKDFSFAVPAGASNDGTWTLEALASDDTGNEDDSPATTNVVVDRVAPDMPAIDSGPDSSTPDRRPTFTFSGEGGASFECRVQLSGDDTTAFAPCAGGTFTPGQDLIDGSYTFFVRATDAAGNVGAARERAFTVDATAEDTTAPDTRIDSGPDAGSSTIDRRPSFGFSTAVSGDAAGYRCSLHPEGATASFSDCTSPFAPTTDLAFGTWVFEVKARDAAGNEDQTPAARPFTVVEIADTPPTLVPMDEVVAVGRMPELTPRQSGGRWSWRHVSRAEAQLADLDLNLDVRQVSSGARKMPKSLRKQLRAEDDAPGAVIAQDPPAGSVLRGTPTQPQVVTLTVYDPEKDKTLQEEIEEDLAKAEQRLRRRDEKVPKCKYLLYNADNLMLELGAMTVNEARAALRKEKCNFETRFKKAYVADEMIKDVRVDEKHDSIELLVLFPKTSQFVLTVREDPTLVDGNDLSFSTGKDGQGEWKLRTSARQQNVFVAQVNEMATGRFVTGAKVTLWEPGAEKPAFSDTTDENGEVKIRTKLKTPGTLGLFAKVTDSDGDVMEGYRDLHAVDQSGSFTTPTGRSMKFDDGRWSGPKGVDKGLAPANIGVGITGATVRSAIVTRQPVGYALQSSEGAGIVPGSAPVIDLSKGSSLVLAGKGVILASGGETFRVGGGSGRVLARGPVARASFFTLGDLAAVVLHVFLSKPKAAPPAMVTAIKKAAPMAKPPGPQLQSLFIPGSMPGAMASDGGDVVDTSGADVLSVAKDQMVIRKDGRTLTLVVSNVISTGGGNLDVTLGDGTLLKVGGAVISTGGGNVISTGGGNVIATGGGNVIATGGGNVIATGGGNVISVGGGNVIATGGGNVIATGGGNVISTGGGNVMPTGAPVIATGGGNVISTGGGNVISTGGGN